MCLQKTFCATGINFKKICLFKIASNYYFHHLLKVLVKLLIAGLHSAISSKSDCLSHTFVEIDHEIFSRSLSRHVDLILLWRLIINIF